MRALRRLLARMRNLATGHRADARLREEMEEHLAMQTDENMRAGMTAEEARRQAAIKLGATGAIREKYHAEEGLPVLENAGRDVRYAVRQLRRSPGYAATAIITLALGIGANTAIFLLTWSIVLKSLPVPHPGELVRYTFRKGESELGLSYPQYEAIKKLQSTASGVFAWGSNEAMLRRNGQTVKIPIALATGAVFHVLELRPAAGRGFETRAGEQGVPLEPEALLSYDYWQREFDGDASAIGQALNVENTSVTIVGVLPRGFDGVGAEQHVDVLLPLSFERTMHPRGAMIDNSGSFWLTVMGRLRQGASLKQAQANLASINGQVIEEADPRHIFLGSGFFGAYKIGVEEGRAGRSWLRWKFEKPLLALEALCGLMMLLCAVNVALLIVSRVSGRLHEFAMRNALGASRGRLVAQVLTETLILGFCGLAGGALLGWELARVLVDMITRPGEPAMLHLKAGAAVFAFTAVISLGTALAAGIWPAWRASRTAPAADLKLGVAGSGSHRLGRWVIPVQVALGLVLLNAALLMAGTLTAYMRQNSGFNAGNVVLAELELSNAGVTEKDAPGKTFDFLHQLESAPGVEAAALMTMAPINGGFSVGNYYTRDSKGNLHVNEQIWPESISRDYFKVMGTRIVEGRQFEAADDSSDRVCILSAQAAKYFFPGQDAIGRYLNAGDGTEKPSERESYRVVGVAQDARMGTLLETAPVVVYLPIELSAGANFQYSTIAVRTAKAGLGAETLRNIYSREFPGASMPRTWRFNDAIDYDLSRQRLLSGVSGGFALLALTLVATGLYGILGRTVTERRREIGIRMALGAGRRQIVTALARSAALRVAIGVMAGALLAAAGGRLVRSLLYGVTPGNPWVALATLALLAAVLTVAFVFPAGRAASVNPMEAIREE
ncbi:MAG TPA: ADOP family duplicated permease [Terracidiphilus sp.]|nr:ADOP family duplicated permease [Terracidiphilus sp.]